MPAALHLEPQTPNGCNQGAMASTTTKLQPSALIRQACVLRRTAALLKLKPSALLRMLPMLSGLGAASNSDREQAHSTQPKH